MKWQDTPIDREISQLSNGESCQSLSVEQKKLQFSFWNFPFFKNKCKKKVPPNWSCETSNFLIYIYLYIYKWHLKNFYIFGVKTVVNSRLCPNSSKLLTETVQIRDLQPTAVTMNMSNLEGRPWKLKLLIMLFLVWLGSLMILR